MRRSEALNVLGLTEQTISQLSIAYKRYVSKHHPDRGGDHSMMVKGNIAKAVLDTPIATYDCETYMDVERAMKGVNLKELSKEELLYWVERYKASYGYNHTYNAYANLENAYNHYDEIKSMDVTLANYVRLTSIKGSWFLCSEEWRVITLNTYLDVDRAKKTYIDVVEDGITYRISRKAKKLFEKYKSTTSTTKLALLVPVIKA